MAPRINAKIKLKQIRWADLRAIQRSNQDEATVVHYDDFIKV